MKFLRVFLGDGKEMQNFRRLLEINKIKESVSQNLAKVRRRSNKRNESQKRAKGNATQINVPLAFLPYFEASNQNQLYLKYF